MPTRHIQIDGHKLAIHELDNVHDSLTGCPLTGSWLWDSAIILSHYLSINFNPSPFSTVLELGAGTGLPGLTAARLGATRVVLTDVAPILPVLAKNVEANELGDRVVVSELVWGESDSASRLSTLGEFDLVLMSDVFFDAAAMAALGETLEAVCGEGTRVLAASEVRPWTSECLNELVSQGFAVVELPSGYGESTTLSSSGEENSFDMFAVYDITPPNRLRQTCVYYKCTFF